MMSTVRTDNATFMWYISGDSNDFECNNGKCIPGDYVCDAEADCPYGEDEQGCTCKFI